MHARNLALAQVGIVRIVLDAALADCPQDLVNAKPGGTVSSIGQILGHAVLTYDTFVNAMCQGKPTLWESGGWAAKAGTVDGAYGEANVNLDAFKEYLAAVYASGEAYLGSATDEDLVTELETPLGKMPKGVIAGGLGLLHLAEHMGDISTIKGMKGLKGIPF